LEESKNMNKELLNIFNLEKSLVYFISSLKMNETLMYKLKIFEYLKLTEHEKNILEDIVIDTKQAVETASIYKEILVRMSETFSGTFSNDLNVVMKFLTSMTIILMIPTFVAGFYGMNVDLPLQNHPHAFAITVVISFVFSIITAIFFKYKNWL
jgi:magnesium transporter